MAACSALGANQVAAQALVTTNLAAAAAALTCMLLSLGDRTNSAMGTATGAKLSIQDSLDVFACHGMAGTWGGIATGIFASKAVNPAGADGLLHGNWNLLLAQTVAVTSVWVYTFAVSYVLVKVLDKLFHFTVTEEQQQRGLDAFHLGEEPSTVAVSGA